MAFRGQGHKSLPDTVVSKDHGFQGRTTRGFEAFDEMARKGEINATELAW